MKEFDEKLRNWTKKIKIDGALFDELFMVDHIPLWWFYERWITNSILPKPFPSYSAIKKSYEEKKPTKSLRIRIISNLGPRILLRKQKKKWMKGEENKGETDLLFVTYQHHKKGESIFRYDSILNSCKKAGAPFQLLFLQTLLGKEGDERLPSLYPYVKAEYIKESKRIAAELNKKWKKIKELEIAPYIKDHLRMLFSKQMLQTVFLYVKTFKKYFREHRIKVVILTATIGLFEKAALVAAKAENIKACIIQHGGWADFGRTNMSYFDNVEYFVWGALHKKELEGYGVDSSKIHIVGSVELDKVDFNTESPKELKTITVVTQPLRQDNFWSQQDFEGFCKGIVGLAETYPDKRILLKLHPREKVKDYLFLLQRPNISLAEEDLIEVYKKSDLVLGIFSTALMKAILMKRPVVVWDTKDIAKPLPLVGRDLCLYYTDSKLVSEKIVDYFSSYPTSEWERKREKLIKDQFYKLDGKAGERITSIIQGLV